MEAGVQNVCTGDCEWDCPCVRFRSALAALDALESERAAADKTAEYASKKAAALEAELARAGYQADKNEAHHAEVVADYVAQLEELDKERYAAQAELARMPYEMARELAKRVEEFEAELARKDEALRMLWGYYLFPINEEQKAQVRAALAEPTGEGK